MSRIGDHPAIAFWLHKLMLFATRRDAAGPRRTIHEHQKVLDLVFAKTVEAAAIEREFVSALEAIRDWRKEREGHSLRRLPQVLALLAHWKSNEGFRAGFTSTYQDVIRFVEKDCPQFVQHLFFARSGPMASPLAI